MFYGPPVPARHVDIYRRVRSGRMPLVGGGDYRRSVTHVENLVQAVRLAIVAPQAAGETYYVVDDEIATTRSIVEAMAEALGVPARFIRLPAFTGSLAYAADRVLEAAGLYSGPVHLLGESNWHVAISSAKAKRELGYAPARSLREGMREAVAWCREQGSSDVGALFVTVALFAVFAVVGYPVVHELLDATPLRRMLLAPVTGLCALTVPVATLNHLGLPVSAVGRPVLFAGLHRRGGLLRRCAGRAYRGAKRVPFVAVLAVALAVAAWPMAVFGFDWLSFGNDDMTTYLLGGNHFFAHGYFQLPPAAELVERARPELEHVVLLLVRRSALRGAAHARVGDERRGVERGCRVHADDRRAAPRRHRFGGRAASRRATTAAARRW